MCARDAERDSFLQRGFDLGRRHQSECIGGDRAIVPRPTDRILDRVMLGHQRDGVVEIAVADFAFAQRSIPVGALAV